MCGSNGTCITVCNMENLDLVGAHTGDSISIYPAQLLSEKTRKVIVDYTCKLACSFNVIGLKETNVSYVTYGLKCLWG